MPNNDNNPFKDITNYFESAINNAVEAMTLSMQCKMRRFYLVRTVDVDPDQTSGTGIVAEGVEFEDGIVAMRWKTKHTSTAIYFSIEDVKAIHGHNGKTVVKYIDAEAIA